VHAGTSPSSSDQSRDYRGKYQSIYLSISVFIYQAGELPAMEFNRTTQNHEKKKNTVKVY
jgi:hypothetical protein